MKKVFDAFVHQLEHLGAAHHLAEHGRHSPISDAELDAFMALAGPLPPALIGWWRATDRGLPFSGAMTSLSPTRALVEAQQNARTVAEGTFDPHLANIRGWADGRWDSGHLREVYWSPGWIPFAEDGCGNLICVDLDPGPAGTAGQIIEMEFQDGQGPYLSAWPDFMALLLGHLYLLEHNWTSLDEDLAVEYFDLSPDQLEAVLRMIRA